MDQPDSPAPSTLSARETRAGLGIFPHMLLTWFGLGLLPAPGTMGSLGSIPFAIALVWIGGQHLLFIASIVVFMLGWICAGLYLHRNRKTAAVVHEDPQWIVIDEVAAQWAVLAVVPPLNVIWYACAFLLFRLFDITKPWPVSWADRKVPGALGIMLDDLLAGLYAAIILVAARLLLARAA